MPKRVTTRTYIVGRYQYNDMPRPKTTACRAEDIDTLPSTMIHPLVSITATTKREAILIYNARRFWAKLVVPA